MNVDPIYHTKLLELLSMKDFAAICQFLHLFHPAFALDDFETEVKAGSCFRWLPAAVSPPMHIRQTSSFATTLGRCILISTPLSFP